MAKEFLTKDDMGAAQFGLTYKYYESQLTAIEEAIWFLHARGIQARPEEQDDLIRLEAKLGRLQSKVDMEFDWFLSSEISVQPPKQSQLDEISQLSEKVEKLTNQQRLAGATLTLLNNVAATASPLMKVA